MGNRKLRSELAKLIPVRLYRRTKEFRYPRASHLKLLIDAAKIKVGDIRQDCDGFNHRVWAIRWSRSWDGFPTPHFTREDGYEFCSCSTTLDRAWTVEEITRYQCGFDLDDWESNEWLRESIREKRVLVDQGLLVCTPEGFPLPKENE